VYGFCLEVPLLIHSWHQQYIGTTSSVFLVILNFSAVDLGLTCIATVFLVIFIHFYKVLVVYNTLDY
jgi:hypothetical protein